MAKLQVVTDNGSVVAEFRLDEMDYLDFSAELDAAIAAAFQAEGRPAPSWLRGAANR